MNNSNVYDFSKMTLCVLKPDVLQRKLSGEIIKYIENNDFNIIAMKELILTENFLRVMYEQFVNAKFFQELLDYMTSGPVVAMILCDNTDTTIENFRKLMGATDPKQSGEHTIRGKYGISIGINCVHGSDSVESVKREIPLFFSLLEICPNLTK